MAFAEAGQKLDEFVKYARVGIKETVAALEEKYKEFRDGLEESLKTADRRGFERGIELACEKAKSYGGITSNALAADIANIEYVAPE